MLYFVLHLTRRLLELSHGSVSETSRKIELSCWVNALGLWIVVQVSDIRDAECEEDYADMIGYCVESGYNGGKIDKNVLPGIWKWHCTLSLLKSGVRSRTGSISSL